jgi:hypothetical protein
MKTQNDYIQLIASCAQELFLIIELKQYLENLFGCPVDVVRKHRHMNEFLQSQIEKDGIYIFK